MLTNIQRKSTHSPTFSKWQPVANFKMVLNKASFYNTNQEECTPSALLQFSAPLPQCSEKIQLVRKALTAFRVNSGRVDIDDHQSLLSFRVSVLCEYNSALTVQSTDLLGPKNRYSLF